MLKKLDPKIGNKLEEWLSSEYDTDTHDTIRKWIDSKDEETLIDAFYKDLEFGTGGLRGIMGVGTNRINKYTLGKATQGFCNHLKNKYANETIRVAISYDSRHRSREFAEVVSDIFTANGIEVYFFDEMRPTPQLSFAIRMYNCHGGVMLTASHNPKEYNGYKAYGSDGCQVIFPEDAEIISEVKKIESNKEVLFDGNSALVHLLGQPCDDQYHEKVLAACPRKSQITSFSPIKIVYSALHGTGAKSIPAVLKKMNFGNVYLVSEQMIPDGGFPTVVYPNPEEPEAMKLALNQAEIIGADIVMATDPDADRVGIAIPNEKGQFQLLNGNQTALLIFNYIMKAWKQEGKLTGKEYIIKTIVTTYLLDEIAKDMGIECYNTLTGFKHMGALMTQLEGSKKFLVGGEESFGYLIGDHARDKDAVVSCAVLSEMCAYYKSNDSSLFKELINIYKTHGLYHEKLISVKMEGSKGEQKIRELMQRLRNDPPSSLSDSAIVKIKDFQTGVETDLINDATSKIDLPTSNVLQYISEDGTRLSARPSGTEPKIKFYCSANQHYDLSKSFDEQIEELNSKIDKILDQILVVP